MRLYILLFISLISVSFVEAQQVSLDDLSREVFVSNSLSDKIKAYRLSLFIKNKYPQAFGESVNQEYLKALHALVPISKFELECRELSKATQIKIKDAVLYTCGQLMLDSYMLKPSMEFLTQISTNSTFSVPAAILIATVQLGNSEGEDCLKTLNAKLISRIKNANTKDLYYLTRARCFVEINQLDKATLQYQQISSSSQYYFDALEETAWAQFKMRRFESARTLLDVLITSYETGYGVKKTVSSSGYFRSRYLLGYIELVERNNEKAKQSFSSLRSGIRKYLEENPVTVELAKSYSKLICEQNAKWIDTKAIPANVTKFLDLLSLWGEVSSRKKINSLIDAQFSYTRELIRIKQSPATEYELYTKDLMNLLKKNCEELDFLIEKSTTHVNKVLSLLKVKAELGGMEIVWSQRAQGVRSIGELLETYQLEVDEVEDYFGN